MGHCFKLTGFKLLASIDADSPESVDVMDNIDIEAETEEIVVEEEGLIGG